MCTRFIVYACSNIRIASERADRTTCSLNVIILSTRMEIEVEMREITLEEEKRDVKSR